MKKVLNELNKYEDKKYKNFQVKLIPTVNSELFMGIRTPDLKKLAKEMSSAYSNAKSKWTKTEVDTFLNELPHKYFDENQLHIFILSILKDYDICIKRINDFLPYIDNWATCDQLSPKVFAKHKDDLLKYINKYIKSNKAYTVRFAIGMLMRYYLDIDFDKKYLDMVLNVDFKTKKTAKHIKLDISTNPDKYYVEMMRAWFFATALAKQYDATLPIIKNKKLAKWTHNKTIQKANESYRVTESHKKELKKYILF